VSFRAEKYPPESLCARDGCGHRFDNHKPQVFPDVPMPCLPCEENAKRYSDVPGRHVFVPRKLAGGALTPSEEREAYQKAMGER
jgi:hypothetical protein